MKNLLKTLTTITALALCSFAFASDLIMVEPNPMELQDYTPSDVDLLAHDRYLAYIKLGQNQKAIDELRMAIDRMNYMIVRNYLTSNIQSCLGDTVNLSLTKQGKNSFSSDLNRKALQVALSYNSFDDAEDAFDCLVDSNELYKDAKTAQLLMDYFMTISTAKPNPDNNGFSLDVSNSQAFDAALMTFQYYLPLSFIPQDRFYNTQEDYMAIRTKVTKYFGDAPEANLKLIVEAVGRMKQVADRKNEYETIIASLAALGNYLEYELEDVEQASTYYYAAYEYWAIQKDRRVGDDLALRSYGKYLLLNQK